MDNASFTPRLASQMHVRIIDPDLPICEGLSVMFRLEGFQTSFAADGDLAFRSSTPIDILIVNLALPSGSGISVLRKAKLELSGVPVFMLTDSADVDAAVLAMKFGAEDVVKKPIDSEHLLGIVRAAVLSNVHIGASKNGKREVEVRGFAQLTNREREVLQLLVNGCSNKESGNRLGISPRTIEVHRAKVMKKLGAKNGSDLTRIVMTS